MSSKISPPDGGHNHHSRKTAGLQYGSRLRRSDPSPRYAHDAPLDLRVVSDIQAAAQALYDADCNVFSIYHESKTPYAWDALKHVRLHPTDPNFGLQAVCAGLCNLAVMCGGTSGNLVVFDCETDEIFNYTIDQLQKRKIPVIAVRTPRGGHVWLRSKYGEVTNQKFADFEIRGRNCWVIVPPSIHKNGTPYSWFMREAKVLPVVDIVADIDFLPDKNGEAVTIKLHKTMRATPGKNNPERRARVDRLGAQLELDADMLYMLTDSTRNFLENGHSIPEGNRHSAQLHPARDMADTGFSEAEIERVLNTIAAQNGLENDGGVAKWAAQKAVPKTMPAMPQNGAQMLQKAQQFATQHVFKGRSANTDRAILDALIERAKAEWNNAQRTPSTFRASYREIQQLARIANRQTVKKSLTRLIDAKILQPVKGKKRPGSASIWRFGTEVQIEPVDNRGFRDYVPTGSVSTSAYLKHDTAERKAIGKSAMHLYHAMLGLEGPVMPTRLAQLTNRTLQSVRYALRKLRDNELVVRSPDGWQAVAHDPKQLDSLAARKGKLGMGDLRKRRFESERMIDAGRIILARRYRFDKANLEYVEPAPVMFRCPNCGQQILDMGGLPDMCDQCQDFTTWEHA